MSGTAVNDPLVTERLELANPNYTVLVRPFFAGQFRIQLTDKRLPDDGAPLGHASIVREMCTYSFFKMEETLVALCAAEDPEAYCESLARPYNCEYSRGRIRLDNKPEDRPETME